MASQTDLRRQITDQIIQALEKNILPWRRPWRTSGRHRNALTHRPYSGVNPLLLELHAMQHRLGFREWATYRQWEELGAQVKRRPHDVEPGCWGCRLVFSKPVTKTVKDKKTGEERNETFFLLRTFVVFNAEQVEGIELPASDLPTVPDYEPAEGLLQATGAEIHFGGDRAFYQRPSGEWPNHTGGDYIQVPHKSEFAMLGSYYETVLHELLHWSEVRLGWSGEYALGELRAEIGACYLSAELGVPNAERLDNHVAYVQSWLSALRHDTSFVFSAATAASKGADHLLSFVRPMEPVGSEYETSNSVSTEVTRVV